MLPTVSVITPSYNQVDYLRETLESVVRQRDDIHEYFVFDGGSNDGSVELIREFEAKIDHWITEKDKGQSDAIHKGFSRATGDIIYWLNSDDVVLPGAIRRVREAFAKNPSWDVLTSYSTWIDQESKVLFMKRVPGESASMMRLGVHHVTQQTCFFRRSLYEKIGGLNLDLHCMMDIDLWFRMTHAGAVWGHLPTYLGAFRVQPEAKGSKWRKQYAEEVTWMKQRFPEFYGGHPLKHRMGLLLYRMSQMLSGRYFAARRETGRAAGRNVREVFA